MVYIMYYKIWQYMHDDEYGTLTGTVSLWINEVKVSWFCALV